MTQTNKVTLESGTVKWLTEDGKLHRENGPALINWNGIEKWYLNGKLHRENGPAVDYSNHDKHYMQTQEEWLINGEYHREDGAAVIFWNGTRHFYIYGEQMTEELYNEKVKNVRR